MAKKKQDTVRTVYFAQSTGLRLTKRFGPVDAIVVRALGDKRVVAVIPETGIDRLIAALLELKVLTADGGTYNSGAMRVALIDGSGVEVPVRNLTDGGKGNAVYLARRLIEEIEEGAGAEADDV